MKNSLSEGGAALMNEEMRVSRGWEMDTDGCSMYAIKEKSQKQEPTSQFIDYRRQVIKWA